jgi:hypothetical protein
MSFVEYVRTLCAVSKRSSFALHTSDESVSAFKSEVFYQLR